MSVTAMFESKDCEERKDCMRGCKGRHQDEGALYRNLCDVVALLCSDTVVSMTERAPVLWWRVVVDHKRLCHWNMRTDETEWLQTCSIETADAKCSGSDLGVSVATILLPQHSILDRSYTLVSQCGSAPRGSDGTHLPN